MRSRAFMKTEQDCMLVLTRDCMQGPIQEIQIRVVGAKCEQSVRLLWRSGG